MSKPWSDIKRGRVRRRAYVRLLVRCIAGGDIGSVPFLVRRVIAGDPHGRR
jgi:hypothetical protein